MNFSQGILNGRLAFMLFTLFCLIEAVWSWSNIVKGFPHRTDLTTALFSLLLSFFAVSIAVRSPSRTHRFIFGTLAVVGALISASAAPLTPTAMLAVEVAKSGMWSFSALVGLAILVAASVISRREKPRE
jgi:CHASE1-domain containing sensor protein